MLFIFIVNAFENESLINENSNLDNSSNDNKLEVSQQDNINEHSNERKPVTASFGVYLEIVG